MQSNITSTTNPKVKYIVALRDKGQRLGDDLTIVEGVREIDKAIKNSLKFKEVYLTQDHIKKLSLPDSIAQALVSNEVFKKISYGNKESGILGLLEVSRKDLSTFKFANKAERLVVVLESVEKPGNLGAVLRTADATGVDLVVVCDQKVDCYNPNVIRASLGTIFSVDVISASKEKVLEFLVDNQINILATTPDAKKLYSDVDLRKSTAIVLGSESDGLTSYWVKNANEKVQLPMLGQADSLNVSVTTAVVLYEVLRQRRV